VGADVAVKRRRPLHSTAELPFANGGAHIGAVNLAVLALSDLHRFRSFRTAITGLLTVGARRITDW
jgi:hypothetical protein